MSNQDLADRLNAGLKPPPLNCPLRVTRRNADGDEEVAVWNRTKWVPELLDRRQWSGPR